MPNFRLFDTQARWSVYLSGIAALLCVGLTYAVFKGMDWEYRLIPYRPDSPMGRYRQPVILIATALVVLLGSFAAGFGYSSLGEKRNSRPGWSWLGMLSGSLLMTAAV